MKDEQAPCRLLAATFFSIEFTAMLPGAYEQLVAQQYTTGSLSIQQAIALLEDYNRSHAAFSLLAAPKARFSA